jgi:hypothetical protein
MHDIHFDQCVRGLAVKHIETGRKHDAFVNPPNGFKRSGLMLLPGCTH